MKDYPRLVLSDEQGQIFDHPSLGLMGSSGHAFLPVPQSDLIPLPPGSELFTLPGRLPVGWDLRKKRRRVLTRMPWDEPGRPRAVAAFLSPAYTRLFNAAFVPDRELAKRPILPLFAYSPVAFANDQFWVPAVRVDPDRRQELANFDAQEVPQLVQAKFDEFPGNRLIEHISHCAMVYRCPAAQNYFYERFEAPIPSSPSCNSACVGCISLQTKKGRVASHDRITFVPSAEEMRQLAVPHLQQAERALVSFGQGCEGEPLNQGDTLEEAIRLIRAETSRGRIHLNSNGSRPSVVRRLVQAGLNSIRVSLNSACPATYNAYYKPTGYTFQDVVQSIREVVQGGGYATINLLLFPGVTDREEEISALESLVSETGLHMIQMRNLNIDPELYLEVVGVQDQQPGLGIRTLMERLEAARPGLRFGYFNPPPQEDLPTPGTNAQEAFRLAWNLADA